MSGFKVGDKVKVGAVRSVYDEQSGTIIDHRDGIFQWRVDLPGAGAIVWFGDNELELVDLSPFSPDPSWELKHDLRTAIEGASRAFTHTGCDARPVVDAILARFHVTPRDETTVTFDNADEAVAWLQDDELPTPDPDIARLQEEANEALFAWLDAGSTSSTVEARWAEIARAASYELGKRAEALKAALEPPAPEPLYVGEMTSIDGRPALTGVLTLVELQQLFSDPPRQWNALHPWNDSKFGEPITGAALEALLQGDEGPKRTPWDHPSCPVGHHKTADTDCYAEEE